jgi:hypothetical protein
VPNDELKKLTDVESSTCVGRVSEMLEVGLVAPFLSYNTMLHAFDCPHSLKS